MNGVWKAIRHGWWTLSSASRRALIGGVCMAAAIILATALSQQWLHARQQDAVSRLHAAKAELARRTTVPAPAEARDFTADLPAELRTEQVARDAAAWSVKFGLQLASLAVQPSIATPGNLQKATLNAELRGRYPDLKLWLRELMARYPELALVSLDIQRPVEAADGTVTAGVQLLTFGRPTTEAAGGGPR